MRNSNKAFYHGFAIAVASVARDHGLPSVAVDIMRCNGVSLQDLQDAGVEQFDLKPIRDEWYATFRYSNWKRPTGEAKEG
jgi:hypothetical protein